MQKFSDNSGRLWTVGINVDAIKRVKSLLSVNLLEAVEGDLLERLATDPILLCDVIYVLCKPDADKLGVTDEQFGQAMAGDAIDAATKALLEDLVDFFPKAKRAVLRKAMMKLELVQSKAAAHAEKILDSKAFDDKVDSMLNDVTDSVMNSEAFWESIPDRTPSES